MSSRFWWASVGLAALLGSALPSMAGGNSVAITAIHGDVQVKSLEPGGTWERAKPGVLTGTYLLRTGPRSWVHLEERGGWRPRNLNRGCVDAGSLVQIQSDCGFTLRVLRGQLSAADGRRGKGRFRTVGG